MMMTKRSLKMNNSHHKIQETKEVKLVRMIRRKERNKAVRRATTLLGMLAEESEIKSVNSQRKKENLRI